MSKSRPSRSQARAFLWHLKTADISFMRPSEAEFAVDGSSDCGAVHPQPQPRSRPARRRALRK